ncbi:MAG: M81 family metallopeptidase [Bryobacteraceae bacterium]|nr:M81 family metallopeptidase [Bryobacteraceae bacterium]
MRALIITGLVLVISSFASAQPQKYVVGIAGVMHESNSFNPAKTVVADFEGMRGTTTLSGADLLASLRKGNTEISGYLDGADSERFDVYAGYIASATPKGPLTRDTFETVTQRMIASLKAAPKLDGILLALHGAMVADGFPQADEEIVRRVRAAFGTAIPVVVTHDFHGNPSPELVKLSTALVGYQQNPHLDTRLRGRRAASIMGRTLRGEIKPVQVIVKPPMVYNIIFQNTYAEPLLRITRATMDLEQSNPKILAATVMGGYQYSDVPWMGPSVVVVTDGDRALAEKEAKRFGDLLWANRSEIVLKIPDPAAAVREAMAETKFPVALFDTGDNVGGGSSADSTFILHELIAQRAIGWVMTIADPPAVEAAVKAGIGGTFNMPVGGKTDNLHGKPVVISGKVKSLHDGDFIETEIRHGGGRYFSMGPTAVIEVEGGTRDDKNLLVLTTRRMVPYSMHQIVSLGIYPERQKILVAKGTVAPRAAYEPISAKIIVVDSPGSTAVNPARFTFKNVREKLWGLQ